MSMPPDVEHDRVRVPEGERHLAALQLAPVADADNVHSRLYR